MIKKMDQNTKDFIFLDSHMLINNIMIVEKS